MKVAKKINTILCDDVRHEIGGKISLIGIYSGDMIVDAVPTLIPSVSFVTMFEEVREPFKQAFIKVILPESDPINFTYSAPDNLKSTKKMNLILALSPFNIIAPGDAKFEVRFSEKGRASIVHKFSIKVNEQQS